jgi:multidrug transporter EmrE-like cation transporter
MAPLRGPTTFQPKSDWKSIMNFLYILATVLFTVYGQLVVKWQVAQAGAYPLATSERLIFLLKLLLNPWIISGVAAGFLALLCWMIAMTRFDLSYAYPFMSLAFVFVLILSAIFFHETVTMPKMIGVMLIVAGIIIGSRG